MIPVSDITVLNPTLILLEEISAEFLRNLNISSELVNSDGLWKLIFPDSLLNCALQRLNFKSSYWLGFHVSPFWDLNNEPRVGWEDTKICSSWGLLTVCISISPILDIHAM